MWPAMLLQFVAAPVPPGDGGIRYAPLAPASAALVSSTFFVLAELTTRKESL
jgi:hypothetical protein